MMACDEIREVDFLTQDYSSELGGLEYCVHEEDKQYGRHVIALANTDCVFNGGFVFFQRELEFEVLVWAMDDIKKTLGTSQSAIGGRKGARGLRYQRL
jgi:hypothetical protein